MASVKDLSIDDLEHLIEQKVLEMLGDPASGLELREEFKKELEARLARPSKRVSQQEVLNRFGQIEWTEAVISDLEKLDRQVAKRILRKLEWCSKNFARLIPEPLSGALKGVYKLRVGDWRVIYTLEGNTVVIQAIGHRFIQVPCVTLRDETEWVETVESGWNALAGCDRQHILEAARTTWPNLIAGFFMRMAGRRSGCTFDFACLNEEC